jgi:hypothetical protein
MYRELIRLRIQDLFEMKGVNEAMNDLTYPFEELELNISNDTYN